MYVHMHLISQDFSNTRVSVIPIVAANCCVVMRHNVVATACTVLCNIVATACAVLCNIVAIACAVLCNIVAIGCLVMCNIAARVV